MKYILTEIYIYLPIIQVYFLLHVNDFFKLGFVTFRPLLHPLWSSAFLTLSCLWTREWGWFWTNLLQTKSSATHQSTFIPSYYLKSWGDMRVTKRQMRVPWKSKPHPALRQLKLYGRSLLAGAEVMFGSRQSV